MLHHKLDTIKQENEELTVKNAELNQITSTMEMERTHVLKPTLAELQSKQNETTTLQTKLLKEQETIKKLNTLNSQIKQENEKYKLGLEKKDNKLRQNEEQTQNKMNSLKYEIKKLEIENEELNRKLAQFDLELKLQKHGIIPSVDQEDDQKVNYKPHHLPNDTIEIIFDDTQETNDNPCNAADSSGGSSAAEPPQDGMTPLILNNGAGSNMSSAFSTPNNRSVNYISGIFMPYSSFILTNILYF